MKQIKKWINNKREINKSMKSLITLTLISCLLDKIGIQMIDTEGEIKDYFDISFEVRDKTYHQSGRMSQMLQDAIKLCR